MRCHIGYPVHPLVWVLLLQRVNPGLGIVQVAMRLLEEQGL